MGIIKQADLFQRNICVFRASAVFRAQKAVILVNLAKDANEEPSLTRNSIIVINNVPTSRVKVI